MTHATVRTDISRLLTEAAAGVDDVRSWMLLEENLYLRELWIQHGGLGALMELKRSISQLSDEPESIFSEATQDRIGTLQHNLINVTAACTWDEPEFLGSLASLQEVISYLTVECHLQSKETLIQASSPEHLIHIPTERSLQALIDRLGPDPRAWYALGSRKFEEVLAEIWEGLGWQTVLTPPSGDGGFDLRAIRNADGVTACYLIEAKAYDPRRPVGIEIIRRLYGVVERERVTHGILATTSYFTRGAIAEARALRYRVSLADFAQVLKWSKQYVQLMRARF